MIGVVLIALALLTLPPLSFVPGELNAVTAATPSSKTSSGRRRILRVYLVWSIGGVGLPLPILSVSWVPAASLRATCRSVCERRRVAGSMCFLDGLFHLELMAVPTSPAALFTEGWREDFSGSIG